MTNCTRRELRSRCILSRDPITHAALPGSIALENATAGNNDGSGTAGPDVAGCRTPRPFTKRESERIVDGQPRQAACSLRLFVALDCILTRPAGGAHLTLVPWGSVG